MKSIYLVYEDCCDYFRLYGICSTKKEAVKIVKEIGLKCPDYDEKNFHIQKATLDKLTLHDDKTYIDGKYINVKEPSCKVVDGE